MRLICSTNRRKRRALSILLGAGPAVVAVSLCAAPAFGQRVFGLDTSSAANFNVTQTQWNNAYSSGWSAAGISSFQFAIVRSSHGGTNGISPASDDPQFYQNITRATTAGMLAGSYHFPHADVYTAADDAQHYLNYAGMYMKPGFLLPVFDLEGSSSSLSTSALTTWSLDFIDTIFQAKGINPIVYTSSSFNTDEVTPAVAFTNIASSPHTGERTYQWLARPSGSILTGDPGAATGYPDPYGGWDPNYTTKSASTDPAVKPWAFWQNGSAHIAPSGSSGNQFLVDFNAANGNIEFVKDFLVPALWVDGDGSGGNWGTTANWNSDNPTYNGTIQSGPAPRLPNNGSLDWVKLQNPAGGTVTLSSGAQTVRKFYNEQPLNITGGSLTVGYVPGSGGKWDLPSEFNAAVTLSSGASYSARTTQVDGGGGQFNINGGTVTFTDIQLASHASNSGKIVMGGNATFTPTGSAGTAIIRSTGSLAQAGRLDLGAATRTLTISNGSAAVDVSIQTAIIGTGGLAKSGTGTLELTGTNTYSGGTTVNSGILRITKDVNLGAVPGSAQASNIILNGGTLQTGSELTSLALGNAGSGYTSFPNISFGGAGSDAVAPTANVLGKITSIQVTAGGNNLYTGTAKVVIVGGGGTGATATATMSSGDVTGINITNQGSGYTSVPTVYITDGSGQGVAGDGAAAVVNAITITGLSLTSPGFDYASPTVTLSGGGGTGAAGSAASSTSFSLSSNRGIQLTASGGTLYQTTGTTFTVGGPISSTGSGALNKSGSGNLVLGGANTFTGTAIVQAGTLTASGASATFSGGNVTVTNGVAQISSGVTNAIADTATLSIAGSGVAHADLGSGVNERVATLLLAGATQLSGATFGSTSATGAMFQNNTFFTGTGIVTVGLLGDYNGNSSVDAGDYVVWRNMFSSNTLMYDTWRANFGNTSPASGSGLASTSAVPEPASLLIATLGLAALAGRRRGR